jgi:4-carboxymuconolactone decarboxylase
VDDKKRYDKGRKTRRAVLGKDHVRRAEARLTDFNRPFQEFITRYAWGEIWERPGLAWRERSLITLAMLVALNREPEFRMHIRAALNNGVTVEEIRELLLHAGIYCGLPAANAAMHAAEEVIAEGSRPDAPEPQMPDNNR